jgi:hypothetical protein
LGYFATINAGRQQGAWQGGVSVNATSPGFEVNDLGQQSAADRINLGWDFGYRQPTTGKVFRNFSVNASGGPTSNFGWEALGKDVGLSVSATHLSQYGFNFGVNRNFDAFDDRLTRGGPLAGTPGGWSSNLSLSTPPQLPVQPRIGFNYSRDDAGGWRKSGNVNLTMRFKGIYEILLGASVSRSHSVAQYVTTVADAAAIGTFGNRYVFAGINQTTLDTNARVNLTFTRDLTLEVYMQPFISSGDYLGLKELAAARTFDFLEYGKDAGTISRGTDGRYRIDPVGDGVKTFFVSDRDFNVRSFIGNAVLRWQWRPGSTLYAVWQQGRSERLSPIAGDPEGIYGHFDLDHDAGRLFGIAPENTFMIKVNYWLNP